MASAIPESMTDNALWAEFERRRQADRIARKSIKFDNVSQILKEVKLKRRLAGREGHVGGAAPVATIPCSESINISLQAETLQESQVVNVDCGVEHSEKPEPSTATDDSECIVAKPCEDDATQFPQTEPVKAASKRGCRKPGSSPTSPAVPGRLWHQQWKEKGADSPCDTGRASQETQGSRRLWAAGFEVQEVDDTPSSQTTRGSTKRLAIGFEMPATDATPNSADHAAPVQSNPTSCLRANHPAMASRCERPLSSSPSRPVQSCSGRYERHPYLVHCLAQARLQSLQKRVTTASQHRLPSSSPQRRTHRRKTDKPNSAQGKTMDVLPERLRSGSPSRHPHLVHCLEQARMHPQQKYHALSDDRWEKFEDVLQKPLPHRWRDEMIAERWAAHLRTASSSAFQMEEGWDGNVYFKRQFNERHSLSNPNAQPEYERPGQEEVRGSWAPVNSLMDAEISQELEALWDSTISVKSPPPHERYSLSSPAAKPCEGHSRDVVRSSWDVFSSLADTEPSVELEVGWDCTTSVRKPLLDERHRSTSSAAQPLDSSPIQKGDRGTWSASNSLLVDGGWLG